MLLRSKKMLYNPDVTTCYVCGKNTSEKNCFLRKRPEHVVENHVMREFLEMDIYYPLCKKCQGGNKKDFYFEIPLKRERKSHES